MNNLGPLPTDFTVSASCASRLNDIYYIHTSIDQDYHPNYLLRGPLEQTICYPGSYTANTELYYSPGQCPFGFTAPCQSTNRAGTVEETVLTCCPTQGNYICQTTFSYPWEKTQGCVSHITDTSTELVVSKVSNGVTSRVTATFDERDAVNAYSIQVRYQSTDFTSRTLSSPTPTPTPKPTPTPTLSRSTESSSPTNMPHHMNSNGAITGAVIAVLAAISIATVAGFLVMRRRRQRQPDPIKQMQHPCLDQPGAQEHQHQYFNPFMANSEGPPIIQELDTRRRTAELDAGAIPSRS
ncbi:hypothetical protein F5Y12DRAFT_716404 [Xylaria sp. FL1777]|nr:hypothetical protein F5Y12DRAFT_716404 [Xylaria sp. FL1777]